MTLAHHTDSIWALEICAIYINKMEFLLVSHDFPLFTLTMQLKVCEAHIVPRMNAAAP